MNGRQSDFELLRGFAREGDQGAFASLTRRHIDLVYATAMRKVGDQGAAEEVAQNVFGALVKKAWWFAADDSLPAWLYRATLLECRQWLRGEMRRRHREETAVELGTTMRTPEEQSALRALVPLLDEALLSLRERDRSALLLRFYENQSLRDVGAALGVNEDAAQKRVAGALEKLSAFFQRRGFRTATVAATTAALEHTAISAPAIVSNSVVLAAAQAAPPALAGLGALAARLAGLTRVQTAAICAALAIAPTVWQWNVNQRARAQLTRLQSRLADVQTELTTTRTEIDRWNATATRLSDSNASAAEEASQRADAAAKFAAWKNRLRGLLTSADYRWPEDSPFVRIPKSAVSKIQIDHSVEPPGTLRQPASEFLGLSPEEQEQIETALHRHFAAIDGMIGSQVYETNRAWRIGIPDGAVASSVWHVPPLGDGVQTLGNALLTDLQNTLGDERWPLVKKQLDSYGTDTLRRVLDLDAGSSQQEVGAWIQNQNGKLIVGYGFAEGGSCSSMGGIPLETFAPGGEAITADGSTAEPTFLGGLALPSSLTTRAHAWIEAQALAQAGKGAK